MIKLDNKGAAVFPKEDQWAAVRNADDTKDYIYLGDKKLDSAGIVIREPAMSHGDLNGTDAEAFPSWAKEKAVSLQKNVCFMANRKMIKEYTKKE